MRTKYLAAIAAVDPAFGEAGELFSNALIHLQEGIDLRIGFGYAGNDTLTVNHPGNINGNPVSFVNPGGKIQIVDTPGGKHRARSGRVVDGPRAGRSLGLARGRLGRRRVRRC